MEHKELKIINWNAHSISNKKLELEQLIHYIQPHIICITETWLRPNQPFNVHGYYVHRKDRLIGRGGGVAILIENTVVTSALGISLSDPADLQESEFVGINVHTLTGTLELVLVYSPLNSNPEVETWQELLTKTQNNNTNRIICGDFNAHSYSWGCMHANSKGNRISEALEYCNLIPANDKHPTYIPKSGENANNLDLIFIPTSLIDKTKYTIMDSSFGSDHIPILLQYSIKPENVSNNSTRINTSKVDWLQFREKLEVLTTELNSIHKNMSPGLFSEFIINRILGDLQESGAFYPATHKGKRKIQPLWWSSACDALNRKRNESLKKYLSDQTTENIIEYKRVNNKVKRELRKIKTKSFTDFCEGLNFDKGLSNIWRTVKGMISKSGIISNNTYTFEESEEIITLRNNLLKEHIPPRTHTLIEVNDLNNPMNNKFNKSEFEAALLASNVRSSPGLDTISYEILRKLPTPLLDLILENYNDMFIQGNFPESWKNTFLRFLPKPGGGFRPISLTSCMAKLFERIVQKRLEYLSETEDWIPDFQFGFRRSRSAMDAASLLACNIYRAFGKGESVVALALDIKGAFSSIKTEAIIQQLKELEAPTRIINFISFLISEKHIFFDKNSKIPRISGVGVPQGGVLSPILFSLALRKIGECLPPGVKIIMYADDIIIYVTSKDLTAAKKLLSEAFKNISEWLAEISLEISLPKTQYILFSRSNTNINMDRNIHLGDQVLDGSKYIKYLGIYLDQRLLWHQHIDKSISKISRANNVLKLLARTSWGPSPSSLLTVCKGMMDAMQAWGAPLIWRAAKTHLLRLDRSFYSSLRTAMGFMKTTPIQIILSEAGFPDLELSRAERAHQFVARNLQWTKNPLTQNITDTFREIHTYKNKLKIDKIGLFSAFENMEGLKDVILKSHNPSYFDLPWPLISEQANINTTFGQDIKNAEYPSSVLENILQRNYSNKTLVFTDASYSYVTNRAAISFHIPSKNIDYGVRTSNLHSIQSLEVLAILTAIQYSYTFDISHILIISDSKSAINLISKPILFNPKMPLFTGLLMGLMKKYRDKGLGEVEFLWVPAHTGILGNEEADRLAKIATEFPTSMKNQLVFDDIKKLIKSDLEDWGKLLWPYGLISNNIYYRHVNVKTKRPWFKNINANRWLISLITRLRSGHVRTAELFQRLNWNIELRCICGFEFMTLNHILRDCPLYSNERYRFLEFLSTCESDTTDPATNLRILTLTLQPGTLMEIKRFFKQNRVEI